MIKKIGYLALFLFVFNYMERFAHKKTEGFSLHRIQFSEAITEGIPEAYPQLNQPFRYLDCGNQCYAFVSADGNYVLKFFKYAKPLIPKFLTTIPLLNYFKLFRPHRYEKKLWKRQGDFNGYKLAFERFRDETGLIAVHLSPTHHNFPTITLTDKLNCVHQLDLNNTPFILQRRAAPIYKQLRTWIEAGETSKAQLALANLYALLKKRIALHIQDDDVNFYSNFGFIGVEAIQLDPGHFTLGETADPDLEMQNITAEITTWCQKHAPTL